MPTFPRPTVALGLTLLATLVPSPARANRTLEVSMLDDTALLAGNTDSLLAAWRTLGVDRVRTNLRWDRVSPAAQSTRKPSGFRVSRHDDPAYDWTRYDAIINGARAHRLRVLVTITGPAPYWATESPRRRDGRYRPRPSRFAAFASAVAARYNRQVDRYSIWNEPNQGGWLQPQSVRGRPYSPHLYRRLVRAAYPRIRARDRSAQILIGETAPTGRNDRGATRPIRPLAFWRAFGCRDRSYRRLRGGYCRGFRPASAHGVAHHPYLLRGSPATRSRSPDDAALGDTRRLLRVLDRLRSRGAIRRPGGGRLPVHYTEYGYQTNPPDPYSGVSHSRQSLWLQWAQYLMWRQPRVRGWTQYTYRDEPAREVSGRERWGGWQAGLHRSDGRPKRYAGTFADPFWASRLRVGRGARVRFWGQYKPGRAHRVALQRNTGRGWRTLRRLQTNSRGYWSHTRRLSRTASYRFTHPGGTSSFLKVRVR